MSSKNELSSLKNSKSQKLTPSEKEILQERYSTYIIRSNYESLNEDQKDYLRMIVLLQSE